MDVLNYDGAKGSVEFSEEDNCWHGQILEIRDLVMYEAETRGQLENEFCLAVDDWRECRKALDDSIKAGNFKPLNFNDSHNTCGV